MRFEVAAARARPKASRVDSVIIHTGQEVVEAKRSVQASSLRLMEVEIRFRCWYDKHRSPLIEARCTKCKVDAMVTAVLLGLVTQKSATES